MNLVLVSFDFNKIGLVDKDNPFRLILTEIEGAISKDFPSRLKYVNQFSAPEVKKNC